MTFIFMELGSTSNYDQEAGEQNYYSRERGITVKMRFSNLFLSSLVEGGGKGRHCPLWPLFIHISITVPFNSFSQKCHENVIQNYRC